MHFHGPQLIFEVVGSTEGCKVNFRQKNPSLSCNQFLARKKTQNYALVIAQHSCYSATYSDYILHNYSKFLIPLILAALLWIFELFSLPPFSSQASLCSTCTSTISSGRSPSSRELWSTSATASSVWPDATTSLSCVGMRGRWLWPLWSTIACKGGKKLTSASTGTVSLGEV